MCNTAPALYFSCNRPILQRGLSSAANSFHPCQETVSPLCYSMITICILLFCILPSWSSKKRSSWSETQRVRTRYANSWLGWPGVNSLTECSLFLLRSGDEPSLCNTPTQKREGRRQKNILCPVAGFSSHGWHHRAQLDAQTFQWARRFRCGRQRQRSECEGL